MNSVFSRENFVFHKLIDYNFLKEQRDEYFIRFHDPLRILI
jgi:hypothetical protein